MCVWSAHINFLPGLSTKETGLRLRVRFCATCCLILSSWPGPMLRSRCDGWMAKKEEENVVIKVFFLDWREMFFLLF